MKYIRLLFQKNNVRYDLFDLTLTNTEPNNDYLVQLIPVCWLSPTYSQQAHLHGLNQDAIDGFRILASKEHTIFAVDNNNKTVLLQRLNATSFEELIIKLDIHGCTEELSDVEDNIDKLYFEIGKLMSKNDDLEETITSCNEQYMYYINKLLEENENLKQQIKQITNDIY